MKKIWTMSTIRMLFLMVAVVVPLNILTLILSNMAVNNVEKQVSAEIRNALELYINQADGAMGRIVRKMHSVSRNDVDFLYINGKEIDSRDEYYLQVQHAVRLNKEFGDIINDNGWITGIYAIYPDKNINIIRDSTYSGYGSALIQYIGDMAKEEEKNWLAEWKLLELNGNSVLLYTANYKNAYYGAWIQLSRLADILGVSSRNREQMTFFTDREGRVYYANDEQPPDKIDVDGNVFSGRGKKYVLVKAESESADLLLMQILFKSELANSLPAMIRMLQIISFIALLILPVILACMQKWIIGPVSRLTLAMEKVEAGNMDFRINEKTVGSEFNQINRNFNNMMDEVSKLKIDVYEEKLEKQRIKLRFLSQQVQPHFILNVMNILYSYEQEEYPLIQKMILCLSGYFRYIVNANLEFVMLQMEMDHIRNYFEIQRIRYPRTFFAAVEYDEEIADCLIPPLIIQNFAENAIKHSMQIGNRMDIFVIAQKAGEDKIRIRVVDTGEGIEEEIIDKIKKFQETGERQESLGVGIQNTIERLNVLYGSRAEFKIAQSQPHGTKIEVVLPLQHSSGKTQSGGNEDERAAGR